MGLFEFFSEDEEIKKLCEQVFAVMDELRIKTEKPVIYLKTSDHPVAHAPITSSKFGGVPYVPRTADVLQRMEGYSMVAQINCAELPDNNIYPAHGILQFWIDNESGGFDSHQIVYYKDVEEHLGEEEVLANYRQATGCIEEEVCYTLSFVVSKEMMNATLEAFETEFDAVWTSKYGNAPKINWRKILRFRGAWLEENQLGEEVFARHKIGGYPYWVQDNAGSEEQDIVLLQIGSEENEEYWKILWGDCGVANWLISQEEADRINYDDVFYNVDCC